MAIDQTDEFLTLSRFQSFSAAAENLNMTQSTRSKHISKLRKEINGKLFDLLPHGAAHSVMGNTFFPYAQKPRSAHETFEKSNTKLQSYIADHISIALTERVVKYYHLIWQDPIQTFVQDLRGCYVNTQEYPYQQSMGNQRNGVCDFLLIETRLPMALSEFFHANSYRDPVVALLPEAHPFAAQTVISFLDLYPERLILLPDTDIGHRWYLSACKAFHKQPNLAPSNNCDALETDTIRLVKAGQGLSLLSRKAAKFFPPGMSLSVMLRLRLTFVSVCCGIKNTFLLSANVSHILPRQYLER